MDNILVVKVKNDKSDEFQDEKERINSGPKTHDERHMPVSIDGCFRYFLVVYTSVLDALIPRAQNSISRCHVDALLWACPTSSTPPTFFVINTVHKIIKKCWYSLLF